MSTITRLKAENIKRLQAVDITPSGDVVILGGQNGNGKSSVLDAIAMALGGKEMFPPKPVRVGEKEASVEVEITGKDGVVLLVKRKIKSEGDGAAETTTIEVSEKRNGRLAKLQGPQAILNAMCGALMFDPLAFTRMKPKEQVQMLKELVGIDTDDLDAQEKRLFQERTEVNRECKEAEALWAAAATYPDAPRELVSMGALVEALNTASDHNRKRDGLEATVREWETRARTVNEKHESKALEVGRLERQLADAREELVDLGKRQMSVSEELSAAKDAVQKFEVVDTAPIRERMANAETVNSQVRSNTDAAEKKAAYDAAKLKADDLTKRITELRERRTELMSSAKWPVPGLAFDDQGVTFNNLPFSQASSREQLVISVDMGFAANPELKVAFIRDGSLIDAEGMEVVAERVAKAGGQCWIERVGDDDPSAVIIENGQVREARAAGKYDNRDE